MSLATTLRDIATESALTKAEKRSLRLIAKECGQLEKQLKEKDEALCEMARTVGCLDPDEYGHCADDCSCIACKARKGLR